MVKKFLLAMGVAAWCLTVFTDPSSAFQKIGQPDANPQPTQLLDQVVVWLDPTVDVRAFAHQHKMTVNRQFQSDANAYLFDAGSVARATQLTQTLGSVTGVRSAIQNYSVDYDRWFTPNDPLFNNPAPPDNFGGQWHLGNNLGGVPHINVAGAWASNITGQGVMIGIIDDGVEPNHPDIVANFSASNTYDFRSNSVLQQFFADDRHGMAVAGLAGARGGNGIGVTGAAPFAGISSQKIGFGSNGTAQNFADATMFNSIGANPSIDIKNHSYGYRANYVQDVLQYNAIATSTAAGTIHVVAAGNGRGTSYQDSNRQMMQSSPNAIAVAALGSNGVFASYSSFGANVFVTAPSSTSGGLGITTSDRVGNSGYNGAGSTDYSDRDYTAGFGGTSASSPIIAGVLALGKEANPNMDTRLAKHILARTSMIVDAGDTSASSDGGWRTNSAGFAFNQNYGFGLVDATAFVNMVPLYETTPLVITDSGTINVGQGIPDNNPVGITRTVENMTGGLMEEVLVTLDITHPYRGDIEAHITSPSNYTSRLTFRANDSADNISWTFLSNAFWGEDAIGFWTIRVADVVALDVGTWNSFSVEWRTGTIQAVPEPGSLILMAILGISFALRRRR